MFVQVYAILSMVIGLLIFRNGRSGVMFIILSCTTPYIHMYKVFITTSFIKGLRLYFYEPITDVLGKTINFIVF